MNLETRDVENTQDFIHCVRTGTTTAGDPVGAPVATAGRTRRTPRRRRPSRAMVDLLRAISESAAYMMAEQAEANARDSQIERYLTPSIGGPPSFRDTDYHPSSSPVAAPADVTTSEGIPASPIPSRITLFRSQLNGSEEQPAEMLSCSYCGGAFRLQDGGAMFEGKAACADCEQRFNRDVVLPAVSKLRPQLSAPEAVNALEDAENTSDEDESCLTASSATGSSG